MTDNWKRIVRTMRTKEKHMKKTKYLAACIAAMMALLVMGCSSGDDDGHSIDYDAEKWAIAGTTLVRYTGAEEDVRIPDGVTVIGESAFTSRGGVVTSVTLPESVKIIEDSAFSGCARLASVKMPAGLAMLGERAFSGCTSLAEVKMPGSVKSIGERAFQNCTSLASVEIGDGVESIGNSAFYGCTSLASVTIPDSVKGIGGYAFFCESLKEVKYGGTEEQWKQIDIDSSAFSSGVKITDKDGNVISNS